MASSLQTLLKYLMYYTITICICTPEMLYELTLLEWITRKRIHFTSELHTCDSSVVILAFTLGLRCLTFNVEIVGSMTSLVPASWQGSSTGMLFLLWSGPYIQLDSCWLPMPGKCLLLHLYAYFVMLTIVVSMYFSCVSLLNCFPPVANCIVFSGTLEATSQERGFHVRSHLSHLRLMSYVCGDFINKLWTQIHF